MCQLLGMNCNTPTDIMFSFTGFAKRGGLTDHHADGFGIAFFEGSGVRTFVDYQSAVTSPVAELIKKSPIQSKHVIAHIRKATQGRVTLANCHPFVRELWGRYWVFAHNGDLKEFTPTLDGPYRPVGTTDSELAFCYLLQQLRERFGDHQPAFDDLHASIREIVDDIASHGTFNMLLSDGSALFAHCSTNLYYVLRQHPFGSVHLSDEDLSVDFSELAGSEDRVALIVTQPLTTDESWTQMQNGELKVFIDGVVVG